MSAPPEETRVEVPGGDGIRVLRWGAAGPPLLLVHGFMGGAEEWGTLPARLASAARIAAVDLPGHGRSDGGTEPGRYAVPRIARELAAVQESLFGGPAWWLGYSMGGRIALAAASEGAPVRGLLLESASPGLEDPADRASRREQDEARARRLEEVGMERFVEEWLALPLFAGLAACPLEVREAARAVRAGQDEARMAAWLRGGGTGAQPSYWDALPRLDIPVRILTGASDTRFVDVAREMVRRLPRASVSIVPGCRHLPHLEAPERWVEWVLEALAEERP